MAPSVASWGEAGAIRPGRPSRPNPTAHLAGVPKGSTVLRRSTPGHGSGDSERRRIERPDDGYEGWFDELRPREIRHHARDTRGDGRRGRANPSNKPEPS